MDNGVRDGRYNYWLVAPINLHRQYPLSSTYFTVQCGLQITRLAAFEKSVTTNLLEHLKNQSILTFRDILGRDCLWNGRLYGKNSYLLVHSLVYREYVLPCRRTQMSLSRIPRKCVALPTYSDVTVSYTEKMCCIADVLRCHCLVYQEYVLCCWYTKMDAVWYTESTCCGADILRWTLSAIPRLRVVLLTHSDVYFLQRHLLGSDDFKSGSHLYE